MVDIGVPDEEDLASTDKYFVVEKVKAELAAAGRDINTLSDAELEKEAQTVDEIIFEFKRAMTPSYGPALLKGRDNSTFLNIPTTFDIKYFYVSDAGTHKENSFLNKISTCFLTNMDVSYGGERYTAYRESETQRKYGGGISGHNGRGTPPQKSQLTLAFQEIEIITQEAIDQGY